jgi:hypothetical protein
MRDFRFSVGYRDLIAIAKALLGNVQCGKHFLKLVETSKRCSFGDRLPFFLRSSYLAGKTLFERLHKIDNLTARLALRRDFDFSPLTLDLTRFRTLSRYGSS